MAAFAVAVTAWPVLAQRVGPEFQVNSFTTGHQRLASIASSTSTGSFVVTWQSYVEDGSDWGIFARRHDDRGNAQGAGFRVNTFTTSAQTYPSVAMDPSGAFIVVWQSNEHNPGEEREVYGKKYDASGNELLAGEFHVNTFTTNWQYFPSVSVDGTGAFVVAWQSYTQDGNYAAVVARRFDANASPVGGEILVNSTTAGQQEYPRVASDTGGSFVVVWEGPDGGGGSADYGIFGQRFSSSGNPQGGEFLVNVITTNEQRRPDVASDGSGNFVVVWENLDPANLRDIHARRYGNNGQPLDLSAIQVNTFTLNHQWLPSVSRDPASGGFVVVWESTPCTTSPVRGDGSCIGGGAQDGSGRGAFGRRYDADGTDPDTGLVGEFQLNATTAGDQRMPDVAAHGATSFTVAWDSLNLDGSFIGIGGRDYGCPAVVAGTASPSSQGACVGGSASFSVSGVTGQFPLSYRWRKNGVDLPTNDPDLVGVQTPTLTINNIQLNHTGAYDCVVRDACTPQASADSTDGVLSVGPPGPVGNTLTVATVDAGVNIQFNWTDLAGATSYSVWSDPSPSGPFVVLVGTASSGTAGVKVPLTAGDLFYKVSASNACGFGPK